MTTLLIAQVQAGAPTPTGPAGDDVGVALGLALGIAYAAAWIAGRLTRRFMVGVLGAELDPAAAASVRGPVWTVRLTVFGVTALGLLFPLLERAGVSVPVGLEAQVAVDWLIRTGLRIALIVVAAFVLIRIVDLLLRRFEHDASQESGVEALERAKRVRTLGSLVRGIALVLVGGAAGLMILRELDIDILPVLTGAGIAGLAIGFGAQTLVKDVISGFFFILDNQIRVGDVADINGTGGLVEQINLRTIVLRDLEGTVHVFPNGTIQTLANRTRDFSFAVLDVGVAYKEDTDRVVAILREVGAGLAEDPGFAPSILAPLEVLGVDSFGDSRVTIKIRIRTIPLKQWEVGRELRRRIKKAFDERGVEIPFPQRTLHFAGGLPAAGVDLGAGSRKGSGQDPSRAQ